MRTPTYINKCVWKTLLTNGCHNGVWSSTKYMGSGTFWIANRQDEHSIEEIIYTWSNKETCHISTPFNFCIYDLTPLPTTDTPNTTTLCISQLWHNPNTLEIRKQWPSLNWGQSVWIVQTPNVLVSNNTMIKLVRFEKCNSKSYKQSYIVWNVEYYLPFEQCQRSNCSLLVHVALELIPKANPQTKLSKWSKQNKFLYMSNYEFFPPWGARLIAYRQLKMFYYTCS